MSYRLTRLNIALMLLDETRFDGDWSKLLSPREREVGLLVARGLTNKEVGRELCLSEGTIKQHIHNIFVKLADAEGALGPSPISSSMHRMRRART
jgi:DNA-binding NarL/FixJ family response regulator